MGFELALFQNALIQKQAVDEILRSNDVTAQYGLRLTQPQALALVETRSRALRENGRVEFGGGVIDKLIVAFCDSPYLITQNYEQTLHALLDVFYYYKNETLEKMSDEDLIAHMKRLFDGVCQGSVELLASRELDQLARTLRGGFQEEDEDDGEA